MPRWWAYRITSRQKAILSSMDILRTTSTRSISMGRNMSFPLIVYVSSKGTRVRRTSCNATSGYSGTRTRDGNGCRFQSERTLKRLRAIVSRNSCQKSRLHISGMLACADVELSE